MTSNRTKKTNDRPAQSEISAPLKQGLYDPQFEHDSCGVGFLVNIKGKKSHSTVISALQILMNLDHHLSIATVLGLGGWLAITKSVEVGTVVAFVSGLSTVRDPWGDLVLWYQNLMVTSTKYRLIAGMSEDVSLN